MVVGNVPVEEDAQGRAGRADRREKGGSPDDRRP